MIREILSLVNLSHILNFINPFLTQQHFEYIKASINKFLLCRDIKAGFIKYTCTECGHYHTIPITYKSRLCPSCGFKYSATWTQKMINDILNIPHRHILFTIPEELRAFFSYDRTLLSKLAKAVNEVMKYQFHNMYKKIARKFKVPKSSPNYFTNSDIVHYGLITVIHTFGRDLKWNPHIHALVSLGGFTKNFTFKKLDYFHVPSIAEYKITYYDNEKVTFFFNDLADDKKKKYVTMDIDKFVQQILIHLPPKNFKMINRFGFYGRNITAKLKNIVRNTKKVFLNLSILFM